MKQRLLITLWHPLIYYFQNLNKSLIYSSCLSSSSQQYLSVLYRGLFLTTCSSYFLTSKQPFLAYQFLIYLLNPFQSSSRSFLICLNLLFSYTREFFNSFFILVFFTSLRVPTIGLILISVHPNNSNTFPIHSSR